MGGFLKTLNLSFFAFLVLKMPIVFANSAPINSQEVTNLLVPDTTKIYYYEAKPQTINYVQKSEEIKPPTTKKEQPIQEIKIKKEKKEEKAKNSAIYPQDAISPTNNFPGHRGPGQLVIYNREYGKTTGTNEFGKEAVVVDDMVVALTGANSTIPKDGYVISGHGSAKNGLAII